ncbi:MAG: ABC transporter substrate-binding protein [Pseudobutyrivibrio sp.]|nr:ABC transporter substrate-binding protein [Pseudobutyrivibrio sp.]
MKKRIVAGMLVSLMAASMVACGSSAPAADTSADSGESAPAEETTAEASGDLITVGFAQVGHESDWRTASTNSVQEAFSEDKGYDLQFVDCDNQSDKQIEAVRQFIQNDVDYIVIDPIVSTGWDTVLTECEDAGIPVIVIDRTIDDSDKYVSWVGSEFMNEGLAAGTWLKDYAAAKGISDLNILVIEGSNGSSAQIGRTDGFKKIADAEGWTILDSQDGNFTQDGGQQVMESYCKSYEGKFNVVVCQNDNEAFGAMDAMKAAGVSYGVDKDVILISFDACKAGLEYVQSGDINADFMCYPLQGEYCATIVKQLEAGETVAKQTFMTEPWYVAEDILKSITYTNNAGEEVTEELVHVTDAASQASY